MELKKHPFKENLAWGISFLIGGFLGVVLVLTLCNPIVRENLAASKKPPIVLRIEVIYIETTPPPVLEHEIPTEPESISYEMTEEIKFGEMELVAQLVQAEAGNQDLMGKRLVADVVLNRVDDPRFPNTVEEVIFQKDPVQFSVTTNGAFDEARWHIDEETYEAVLMEYENRTNSGILYFSTTPCNGTNHFKHGDHWFGY